MRRNFVVNKVEVEEDGAQWTRVYFTFCRVGAQVACALIDAQYGYSTFIRWEYGGSARRQYTGQRFPRARTLIFNIPANLETKVFWAMEKNRFCDDKMYYQKLMNELNKFLL